jgi:uncharacterized protein (TIGR02145 family)
MSWSSGAWAQTAADEQKLIKRIPAGHRLHSIDDAKQIFRGDLNGDGADDYALIIEEASDDYPGRGVMIFFKDGGDYKLALENIKGLGSKGSEDCGACGYRSISFNIAKGNFYIYYQWGKDPQPKETFTFRYRNSEFELIGYDVDVGNTKGATSINFPAKKKLVKECPKGKKCKETWTTFTMEEPILLRKIADFTRLELADYMKETAEAGTAGTTAAAAPETPVIPAATVKAIATVAASAQKGTFTDSRNGQTYKTVTIGGKTWTAENMNIKTGTSWCHSDAESNCKKYGRLYNWSTAAKMVCPTGWHLPTRDEWAVLAKAAGGSGAYGGSGIAGKTLKSTSGWSDFCGSDGDKPCKSSNGTDNFGFNALSGSSRMLFNDQYNRLGENGSWWTATEEDNLSAYGRHASFIDDRLEEQSNHKDCGLSVRCVKD